MLSFSTLRLLFSLWIWLSWQCLRNIKNSFSKNWNISLLVTTRFLLIVVGTFSRRQGQIYMDMTFSNKAMQAMGDFAIQFNKNRYGIYWGYIASIWVCIWLSFRDLLSSSPQILGMWPCELKTSSSQWRPVPSLALAALVSIAFYAFWMVVNCWANLIKTRLDRNYKSWVTQFKLCEKYVELLVNLCHCFHSLLHILV